MLIFQYLITSEPKQKQLITLNCSVSLNKDTTRTVKYNKKRKLYVYKGRSLRSKKRAYM